MARRIPHQRAAAALRKHDAGQELTRQDRLALDNLTSKLGLSKPIADYAPRTRRRYLAAAREGLTAQEVNRKEWTSRPDGITGAKRLTAIENARAAIENSSVEGSAHQPHSREEVAHLIDLYGAPFVMRLLTDQLNSITAYQNGDNGPGRRRWFARDEIIAQYRDGLDVTDLDPYFYYHGTLS